MAQWIKTILIAVSITAVITNGSRGATPDLTIATNDEEAIKPFVFIPIPIQRDQASACDMQELARSQLMQYADNLENYFHVSASKITITDGLNFFHTTVDLAKTDVGQRDFSVQIKLAPEMISSGYAILANACNLDNSNIGVVFGYEIYDHPNLALDPMFAIQRSGTYDQSRQPTLALNPHLHQFFNIRFSAAKSIDSGFVISSPDPYHGHVKVSILILPTSTYKTSTLPFDDELVNYTKCPADRPPKLLTPENRLDHMIRCSPATRTRRSEIQILHIQSN